MTTLKSCLITSNMVAVEVFEWRTNGCQDGIYVYALGIIGFSQFIFYLNLHFRRGSIH